MSKELRRSETWPVLIEDYADHEVAEVELGPSHQDCKQKLSDARVIYFEFVQAKKEVSREQADGIAQALGFFAQNHRRLTDLLRTDAMTPVNRVALEIISKKF